MRPVRKTVEIAECESKSLQNGFFLGYFDGDYSANCGLCEAHAGRLASEPERVLRLRGDVPTDGQA